MRFLLSKVRQEVKCIKFLDLRDTLLRQIDDWRAFVKRRLQYFMNMLLFPVVGYGKENVRVHFEGYWLEPREYTVGVMPSERRGIKHDSHFFLRSL